MKKSKCVNNYFKAKYDASIESFINEYLSKYEVTQIIETPFSSDGYPFINITIIYNEDVIDDLDKTLLKEIIKLDNISINNATTKLSIGYCHSHKLINLLEELKIISSKDEGRGLLMNIDEANNIIDSIDCF